jgi:FMN phosphatase YigB (HAD superfamily)
MIRAVIFDLGGVVLESPFVAFHSLEEKHGLERGTIATAIKVGGEQGALACLERGEINADQFYAQFEREIGEQRSSLGARDVTAEMARVITVRPVMVEALRNLRRDGYKLAALTNNSGHSFRRRRIERPWQSHRLSGQRVEFQSWYRTCS